MLPLQAVDFVHEVAPVLKTRCAECHMGVKHKGGLSMNSREDLLKEKDAAKDALEAKAQALMTASQKLGEAMYAKTQAWIHERGLFEGQAPTVDYAPLPKGLLKQAKAQVSKIVVPAS